MDDYEYKCRYCGVKPHAPGPHHLPSCSRYKPYMDYDSYEAREYNCKHCGANPFLPGPHHKKNCPRWARTIS